MEKRYVTFLRQLHLISKEEKKQRKSYLKMIKYGPEVSKVKFPATAKNVDWKSNRTIEFHHKRGALFASFSKNCVIDDVLLFYLSELKKEVDFIFFVADNPLLPNELEKLTPLVDFCICRHHGEYDFGSWKIAFQALENSDKAEQLNELVFCNDSIIGPVQPLKNLFKKFTDTDFFGISINRQGFDISKKTLKMVDYPHVQSYFFVVSKKIFQNEKFKNFICGVKRCN